MNLRIVDARDERRHGRPDSALTRAESAGEIVRMRRGSYAEADAWHGLDAVEQHRHRALAFLRAAHGAVVFARETAAIMLGIPVIGDIPDRPVVAVTPRTTCTDAGAIRIATTLAEEEIVRVGGVLSTSPLRTAIDLGAARGADAAVVALSDVVRRWGVTVDAVEEWLVVRRPFRGVRALDAVIPAVSALSETPIESLGMLRFHQLGFELPEQQVPVRVGDRLYRPDYTWRRARVFGEADGRLKYEGADDVWAEKLREDDLRSVSSGFARFTWGDLFHRERLDATLTRAGVPRRDSAFTSRQAG